jgi:hypothetical protein
MRALPTGWVVPISLSLVATFLSGCAAPRSGSYAVRDLSFQRQLTESIVHEGPPGEQELLHSTVVRVEPSPALAAACKGRVDAVEETAWGGNGAPIRSRTHYCLDQAGYGHFAFEGHESETRRVYATKYELLTDTRVGQSWSGVHGEGEKRNTRSCLAESTPFCVDGVATLCTTEYSTSIVWLRQHYCRGEGWRGFESVIVRSGEVAFVSWSRDVVADGTHFLNVDRPLPSAKQALDDLERIRTAIVRAREGK